MTVTTEQGRGNGAAEANTQAPTKRPEKLDNVASAWVVVTAERTRKEPEAAVLATLDAAWKEGVFLARKDGQDGTDRWLRNLKTRAPDHHFAIVEAIARARADPAPVFDAGYQAEDHEWGEPLLSTTPPTAPFPVDILPPELADLVASRSTSMCAPIDFLAISALAVASIACGRSVALAISEDWSECPSFYAVLVANSGVSKSPPMTKMAGPLYNIEKKSRDRFAADKKIEDAKPKKDQLPVAPLKRAVVDDATVESLAMTLRDNPRGIGMIRDEITALVCGLNQYKAGGKGADLQFFLSAQSGVRLSVDRKGNPDGLPIVVPHPFLTILGGLVPTKLTGMSEAKSREDGFLQRFLFSMPDPVPVRWRNERVDPELIRAWSNAVQRLHSLELTPADDEDPGPWVVRFTPAAMDLWGAWFDGHCIETESDDFPSFLCGSWAKMRAYCGRLALLLDRLAWAYDPTDDDHPRDVGETSLADAIRLIDYFKAHTRRAMGLILSPSGEDNEDARAILKWVRATNRRTFTDRDARDNFEGRFSKDQVALERAVAWLADRRCIRTLPPPPPKPKGGRPATRKHEVNPSLLEGTT